MSTGTLNAPNPTATRDPASVNAEDWAIVVGIDVYPGLKNLNLQGSSNDANEMYQWLTGPAPSAGGVPKDQARLIRSSDFPGPFASPLDGRPAHSELERELLRLDARAKANNQAGQGFRIGRRLYLYFSGHGCAPELNESALLAADASPDLSGLHIPGRLWAHVFRVRGYFDEVILLMDCCRESFPTIQVRKPPLDLTTADTTAVDNGRRFYGFATKWSRTTKEIPINGVMRGVFTHALLQGLGGKACDPGTGVITADSLASWLSIHMLDELTPQQLDGLGSRLAPDLDYDPTEARQIVLARVRPQMKEFSIRVPAAWVGQQVQLLDGFLNPFQTIAQAPAELVLQLLPGLYLLQRTGSDEDISFRVPR